LAGFRPPPNSPWTSADVTLFQHLAGSDGASGDVQALTPAQLSHIAKVIHEIHSHATPDGKAERRVLLMWLTGTSQVNAQVCMSKDFMFAEQPGHSYVLELTLGLAAAAIEGGTPAAQYTSALGGLLTYYRAERAAGTAADPAVEKLLAEQAAGTLAAHAVTLSACVH
jgi:hypothetical protein